MPNDLKLARMLPARGRRPGQLCQSVSMLALGLALLAAAPAALAQSVTVTGAVYPMPPQPLANWNLGGGILTIGDVGPATLTIAGGGSVTSEVTRIGNYGSGTVTVTGVGSLLASPAALLVGYLGGGDLRVEDGGAVTSSVVNIGYAGGVVGNATVTGAGSRLTVDGDLDVGERGRGTLTVSNGGSVSNTYGYLGTFNGSSGTATVTGAGSSWTNSVELRIGHHGTGTLTIEKGGKVSAAKTIIAATGTGTLNLLGDTVNGRGVLETGQLVKGAGSATLNLDGGILRTARNESNFLDGFGSATIGTNGVFFDSNGYDIAVSTAFDGSGGLTKQGAGTLTLTGTNSYSGGTTITGGALAVSADANLGDTSGGVTLDGGTLRATASFSTARTITLGTSGGSIMVDSGQTLTASGNIIGGGGLTKAGDGTLSLIGFNSYTGGTTIAGGKLIVGFDGNLGDSSGGLTLAGGTLATTQSFSSGRSVTLSGSGGGIEVTTGLNLTLTGTISGTGGLTKTGAGMLMLSGTSTYSGATTVSAGTLYINGAQALSAASNYAIASGALLNVNDGLGTVTAGSIAGAGQIRIESGSTLETGATHASTSFTGMIYDAGSIRKVGTGTLTLTQENSYAGGTTIAGGAISISRESNLGSTSGALTLNGGVLQVTGTTLTELNRAVVFGTAGGGFDIADAGNSFTLSQSFSGTGAFSKAGAGTLLLKSTQSYSGATTVSGGTLRAGQVGSFSAASAFTVASGARLDLAGFSQSIGSLAGAGMVTLGAGTLTAGSDNSSTGFAGSITGSGGLTKAGAGTLTLSGASSYAGSTQVQAGKLVVNGSLASAVTLAGGTLGGSGTVGAISVGGGATVAPGNSIGTLTVSGNVAFASGSIYQVEVNAAGQSDRIVASGLATLAGGTVAVLAETGNYAASTNYTILTAAGGVSGQFANVTSNLAFLTPSLSYGATSVTLTMARNQTGFATVALTRNQGLIANAAERLSAGNPVYDTLLSSTAAEARAGFDLLSGEAHAQAVAVMIDESRLVRETILSRLRGPLLTAPAGEVAAAYSADLPGRKGAVAMPAPLPQSRYAFWGEAFGGMGNSNADGNAASQSRRSGGALLGADMLVYDNPGSSLRLGLAGGYSQSRFDLDARLSSGRLESGHAGLYAGARFGSLRLDMGAAYSWSESDIRRQVAIRGFGDVLHLQRPGSTAQAFAELGHGFAFQGFALEPFAQLALIRVSTDAGTEQGGAAALRLFSSEQTLGFSTLGLRAEAQLGTAPLFARAMLGWRHGFGDLTPVAKTAFLLGSTPAQVYAAAIDRNALATEAGLDWRLSSATSLGLTYSAAIGERSRYQALKGRVDVRF
ncbi:autotransporter domain-containing protein [Bosea sp. BIWAKO-01]|uniref:autotransporter outer membrane beta-barrel domain-containing protein n=1 Tax=Bosea sp. BIWAKO-01 TaxID=506668 RepID=UPI00085308C1|nr:autotransporter domain-containing protein [Bosea sp. BIWAKO-01]GAU80302.1 autotransporter protein [Bosea sp. BIWAKO-01]